MSSRRKGIIFILQDFSAFEGSRREDWRTKERKFRLNDLTNTIHFFSNPSIAYIFFLWDFFSFPHQFDQIKNFLFSCRFSFFSCGIVNESAGKGWRNIFKIDYAGKGMKLNYGWLWRSSRLFIERKLKLCCFFVLSYLNSIFKSF
jgi:hypothetical protein